MSESPETTPGAEKNDAPDATADSHVKTFDAEYVRKLREEAAGYRIKAQQNADAAARLKELEDSQKSAEEQAAEREKAAIARAEKAEKLALRREIALEHSLSSEDAALLDSVTGEDAMRNLAKRLSAEQATARKTLPVPNEGTSQPTGDSEERDFVAQLTRR